MHDGFFLHIALFNTLFIWAYPVRKRTAYSDFRNISPKENRQTKHYLYHVR